MNQSPDSHGDSRPAVGHRDRIVVVAGLRANVPDHWQTRFAAAHPQVTVVDSFSRSKLDLDGRIRDLQDAVDRLDGPATILAHSAGVLVTVHWAARSTTPVRGALLATPPDLTDELPAQYPRLAQLAEAGWLPIPTDRLRFPSVLGVSANDPLGHASRVRALGQAWGSEAVDLGAVGHLNPEAGYGEWPGLADLLNRTQALAAAAIDAIAVGTRAPGATAHR
ncbi:MAG: RBBP9/YdeN family alpha/beta hydrolase [Actinomycetales bacterium]